MAACARKVLLLSEQGHRRAAQPLQEIDNTAFTAPRGYRRAAVAAPDGGTCVDKPIHSRRNARAARLASPCGAVLQSMRQSLGRQVLAFALSIVEPIWPRCA